MKNSTEKILSLKGKTAVFIDYANIKSWARENGLSFDMEVLYRTLTDLPVVKILLYYGTDPKNVRSSAFLTKMRKIGFEVITNVVNYLRSKAKRVIVVSGKKYLAGDLAKAADGFLFLDELRFKVKDLFKNHIPPKRDRDKSNITLSQAAKPVKNQQF